MDSNISHDLEQRLRNIEAHLDIGQVDEETGDYSVETHESLVPPEPDIKPPGAPVAAPAPPKSVAELEAELDEAREREAV